jgi:shikimate kinase/3-dehydroquinate synthase
MGAAKSTIGAEVARRIDRRFVDSDAEIERAAGTPVSELFDERGEESFRALEREVVAELLADPEPAVVALGGGAVGSEWTRQDLQTFALTVLLEVEPGVAWERVRDSDRPLARDESQFRALYAEREPLYHAAADVRARDADDVVLAAAGVHVAAGALERLGELVPYDEPVALVSDAHVAGVHGATAQLALGGRVASTHELPLGEDAKTVAALEQLWRELRLDRHGMLVALGGGCTTDAAGFAAATYLRGIDWTAAPTTLVGQVDAAIGGKTAINLPEGKNLVGAFHWPVRTVIDPALLATLPESERENGLAEVVKTGLLAGEPLWELPEPELVRRCAAYKAAVCLRDPHEEGERAVLNLGHTFGHALEAASGGAVSHGHAVALGLLAALRLSVRHLELDPDVVTTAEGVLRAQPVAVDREAAWRALRRDKKNERGEIRLVLLQEPGTPVARVVLPDDDVRAELDALIAS